MAKCPPLQKNTTKKNFSPIFESQETATPIRGKMISLSQTSNFSFSGSHLMYICFLYFIKFFIPGFSSSKIIKCPKFGDKNNILADLPYFPPLFFSLIPFILLSQYFFRKSGWWGQCNLWVDTHCSVQCTFMIIRQLFLWRCYSCVGMFEESEVLLVIGSHIERFH